MKTLRLIGLIELLGLLAHAQLQYVDTTTKSTIPVSNSGWLSVSNPAGGWLYLKYYYQTTNPAFVNLGDQLPVAFGKLNGDVAYLATAVRTVGITGNGLIPMSTNTSPAGYVWVPVPTGGGSGGTSNAIGNLGGLGTNTVLYGTTWLDSSNLSVSQALSGGSTNYVYFSNGGLVFEGLYAWNTASNCYINVLHSNVLGSFMHISNNTVFESAGFAYYTNTATFPGTANSWISAAGSPYNTHPGTLWYTNLADTIASRGAINLTAPYGVTVNGSPIGGTPFTNTIDNAGIVSPGGIGTNLPVPYWALTATVATNAMVATNDPNGDPLASLQAATNAAAAAFGGAISNWYGVGTNLVIWPSPITNYNVAASSYQVVERVWGPLPLTNGIYIYGGETTYPTVSGLYVWDGVEYIMSYVDSVNGYTEMLIENGVGNGIYINGGWGVYSVVSFPYTWATGGSYSGTTPLPTGQYAQLYDWYWRTNTYQVLPNSSSSGGSQPAISSPGAINAQTYQVGGLPWFSVIQGMTYPSLWVTNCPGMGTNFQGAMINTGAGWYTNAAGACLIPPGYWGSGIDGTNFTTAYGILGSNLVSALQGYSYYFNTTNVLGYYTANPGQGTHPPTNQPLVTVWSPTYVTTNMTGTFNGGTHTAYFTNGILMNFQ